MNAKDEVLRFLLPDLLGAPNGVTDKEGNMIFPTELPPPPDSYIFFIPTKEWQSLKEVNSGKAESHTD